MLPVVATSSSVTLAAMVTVSEVSTVVSFVGSKVIVPEVAPSAIVEDVEERL